MDDSGVADLVRSGRPNNDETGVGARDSDGKPSASKKAIGLRVTDATFQMYSKGLSVFRSTGILIAEENGVASSYLMSSSTGSGTPELIG